VDGKAVIEPEEVYTAWPQLRMAVQMLQKMPEGAARKNFEGQLQAAARSLKNVKDTFQTRYDGPVSEAYSGVARPPDEEPEKQKYFDAVFMGRPYVALQAHLLNAAGEEAELPLIRYNFRK